VVLRRIVSPLAIFLLFVANSGDVVASQILEVLVSSILFYRRSKSRAPEIGQKESELWQCFKEKYNWTMSVQ